MTNRNLDPLIVWLVGIIYYELKVRYVMFLGRGVLHSQLQGQERL